MNRLGSLLSIFYKLLTASIVFLLLFSLPQIASAAVTANEIKETKWTKVKDKEGIQVYRAHSETSRLKTFRVVTRFELEDIRAFAAMMLDGESYPEWGHMVSGTEITPTKSKLDYGVYMTTRLPWPVMNRHVKGNYHFSQSEDYSILIELTQAEIPPPARKGYILSPEVFGYFFLKPIPNSKEVELTTEIFVDPGGYVPAFMVNLITDDVSFYTNRKLRKYVQKYRPENMDIDFIKRRPWDIDSAGNQKP